MKILVPTDGSSCATRAFKYAAKLVGGDGRSAVVSLSVHDHHGAHLPCPQGGFSDNVYELTATEHKTLRLTSETPGAPLEAGPSNGHVAEEIVRIAEAGGFDLIVMGTKGRSPLGDPFMGSVAHKVLTATRLPVTLVK